MNIKDVGNLAELARIELSEEEKKSLLSDMDSILGYVKQIEEIKIERPSAEIGGSIKPSSEAPHTFNVWREDEIVPRDFSRELIIDQFPFSKNGFLKVKKIL
jgi:aspartyl-tRNA(Asn)/glutamyl-tRNA(Gln) amidotransferase subunit C